MRAIDVLVATINAQLTELNKPNYKIYDSDNPEYYIIRVGYDGKTDELYFETQEDR
ncbi:MAG: hypothetical protein E6923_13400 [Clostridium sp.]|uniref:hypothetical protein n=1 Tax=Clostridium sp. TaxID=1506 RepID=UPI0028FE9339|nr:hypothetical protein [Clostridium sp.]MDU1311701.1 hypothetical protein [Clostridium sp.]MDU1408852.1 hypothetical protein [Clostridium sp.]